MNRKLLIEELERRIRNMEQTIGFHKEVFERNRIEIKRVEDLLEKLNTEYIRLKREYETITWGD